MQNPASDTNPAKVTVQPLPIVPRNLTVPGGVLDDSAITRKGVQPRNLGTVLDEACIPSGPVVAVEAAAVG